MGDGEASTADEAENAELHQFDRPILGTPNVCLWALKKKYLHAFHKKSKTGQGIFIVREHLIQVLFACGAHSKRNIALRFQDRAQGFLDFANSAGSLGVEPGMCTRYMQFLREFCFTEIDKREAADGGRFIRICDVGDVNLWSLGPTAVAFFIQMLAPLPSSYQDRVERVYIINSTSVFSVFLSLCSSVFSADFLSKVSVYTSWDKERLAKDLLEVIDADCLPVEFGGTCACEGEGGCWKNAPEELLYMKMMAESTPEEDRIGEPSAASPKTLQ